MKISTEIINKTVASIQELDTCSMEMARQRLDSPTKPRGVWPSKILLLSWPASAGVYWFAGSVIVLAGDHGIAGEVSVLLSGGYPPDVKISFRRAAINVLARLTGAHVTVVDMGVLRIEPHENLYIYRVKREPAT